MVGRDIYAQQEGLMISTYSEAVASSSLGIRTSHFKHISTRLLYNIIVRVMRVEVMKTLYMYYVLDCEL